MRRPSYANRLTGTMRSFMFDTNIFNHILDGGGELAQFVGKARFFATEVQFDELIETGDETRRTSLIGVFEKVPQETVPTESFVLDKSKFGGARLGEGEVYEKLKDELDRLNKGKPNNIEDTLIAETAIKNNFTLVTDDGDLSQVAEQNGGSCMTLKEFLIAI